MHAKFDHLVVGAANLEDGAAWARKTLGVEPHLGGTHLEMGTHNLLARMDPGYLEIIAINPDAAAPVGPRWYGLDTPEVRAALAMAPRPIAWVAAVDDLTQARVDAPWSCGEEHSASRGDLTWRYAAPRSVSTGLGVAPSLIEWPEELDRRAPLDRMPPLGLKITEMILASRDPMQLHHVFNGFTIEGMHMIFASGRSAPRVSARIECPAGEVVI